MLGLVQPELLESEVDCIALFQKLLFHPPKDGKLVKLVVTILSGCFFKPELTDQDSKRFWRIVRLIETKDKLVYFLKFHWLFDKFKI